MSSCYRETGKISDLLSNMQGVLSDAAELRPFCDERKDVQEGASLDAL